jgi:hypothetical protein
LRILTTLLGVCLAGAATAQLAERTSFQAAVPYAPDVDIAADMVMVYGVGDDFAARCEEWKRHGYTVSMMTGISWGNYDAYYQTEDGLKEDEIQTNKTGRLFMHGNSTNVGYNVPSPEYVEFIKAYITPAIDYGVHGIFLEEPEYWANTGWSAAFKKEWERQYGEAWQAPDTSVDAQWRASLLKYDLYFNALKEVFRYIKARAAEQGKAVECHVPTHSLINYAHWRIVSPMARLMEIPELDGYIAQTWTGTARTHHKYRGLGKERTLETAYLEYGQMDVMTRTAGKKLWFLADPIEDNPNYDWDDYRRNYEKTVVASLFWPGVARYEVMPWPGRIFRGQYPETKGQDTRVPMPGGYKTELLAVINALSDMDQDDVEWLGKVTEGIGVIVSDTMMFQRAAPSPSDGMMGSFYGMAMPLLKAGIPLVPVQLESITCGDDLAPYGLLILSYEHQKPLKAEFHDFIASWVRSGGALLYIGDGSDPYHAVRAWWNNDGKTPAKAYDDLFQKLGIDDADFNMPRQVDRGWLHVVRERPRDYAETAEGAARMLDHVSELALLQGTAMKTSNHLHLRRGPYHIAAVFDESLTDAPLTISGMFIDVFDPELPVVEKKTIAPGGHTLLYDLEWAAGAAPSVAAASTRIREPESSPGRLTFRTRGPAQSRAVVRIMLPEPVNTVEVTPNLPVTWQWDANSSTALIEFENQAADVEVTVRWPE